jgi:hypothetical protein
MSTSPDDVLQTLSWFLVGRADADQVREVLADPDELGPASTELVNELRAELAKPDLSPTTLQPLVRETIEAIAHGD